jgi:molybdate transport system ATP-binding protein
LPELPHLSLQLGHRVGTLEIDVSFKLKQRSTIIFGPSGSGKTTILRAICGLTRPASGSIVCRTTVLSDAGASIFVPTHLRPVRLAGQAPHLFPHLTLQQNLLFGAGWPSKPLDQSQIVGEIMEIFRITALHGNKPHELSGGEQQRASVARALVSATTWDTPDRPVLLLDEPFSGLESTLRDNVVRDLQVWVTRWKIPVLSVTHDVAEAFQLGPEVIKIAEGKVVEQGPVEVVLAEERRRLMEQLGA